MAKCSTCGAEIVWGLTTKGKKVPLDPPEKRMVDVSGNGVFAVLPTHLSHFATCPQADLHRKEKTDG